MPTPAKGPRLGSGPAHERLLLAGLATALFEHGRLRTTEAKARRLRPVAERLVSFAKRGDLHARRRVLRVVRDRTVVRALFADIGPRYADRPGGYTRITKLGPRKGDNAPMALIELVEARTAAQEVVGEAERARGTRFVRRRAAAGTARPGRTAAGEQRAATAADRPAAEPAADPSPAQPPTAAGAAADQPTTATEPAADQPPTAADRPAADQPPTEVPAAGGPESAEQTGPPGQPHPVPDEGEPPGEPEAGADGPG